MNFVNVGDQAVKVPFEDIITGEVFRYTTMCRNPRIAMKLNPRLSPKKYNAVWLDTAVLDFIGDDDIVERLSAELRYTARKEIVTDEG